MRNNNSMGTFSLGTEADLNYFVFIENKVVEIRFRAK